MITPQIAKCITASNNTFLSSLFETKKYIINNIIPLKSIKFLLL